jgi:predicted DNA-binding antitoxin AbrB/MazE fold protein
MSEIITAVYEKWVLRPTEPLNLRECQTVRLQVLDEELASREGALAVLRAAGMLHVQLVPAERPPDPVSAEERKQLAKTLGRGPGRPLSQIVIDERGPR